MPWWPAVGVASVVLAVLVASPGVYQIARLRLPHGAHLHRCSSVGRRDLCRPAPAGWVSAAVVAACGTFAAITLGSGWHLGPAGRPGDPAPGALVVGAAIGWLALVSVLGASAGSGIATYAHLVGRRSLAGPTGIVVLLSGLALHPDPDHYKPAP